MKILGVLPLVVAALSVAAPALASPVYPGFLQKAADMPCAPPCTICHQTLQGGRGSIRTGSFGENMQIVGGLVAAIDFETNDPPIDPEEGLKNALQAVRDAETDTDGDGKPDYDELHEGLNPTVKGAQRICGPEYGCIGRVEPRGRADGSSAAIAAVVVGLVMLGTRILGRKS